MNQVHKKTARWAASTVMVLKASIRSFSVNRNLEAAATLAYYGFLSLMPLVLLLVFILGLTVQSSASALDALRGLLSDLFPAFNEDLLRELASLSEQRVWGVLSFVLLIWSMTPFAGAARHSIVNIFKGEHRPAFVREKMVDLVVVSVLLVMFLLLTVGRIFVQAFPGELAPLLRGVRSIAMWAFGVGMVGCFYKVFAPVKLRWRDALIGAGVAAVLLVVIRPIFVLILNYNPTFGYAFGSLKAIFLLIIWVYYTFAVLLFGGEVAANTRRREALVLREFLASGAPAGQPVSRLLERFLRRLEPGAVLFREGEPGHEMFIVRRGAVRLSKGEVELRTMRAGDYFGEMSMLLGAPRSATATVVEDDAELVAIGQNNLELILRENPAIVRRLLADMAARLQAMNERVAIK